MSMTVAIFATVMAVSMGWLGALIMMFAHDQRSHALAGMLLGFAMICAMIMVFILTWSY